MNTQEPALRVALVGCGRIADLQCLGYLAHPRATIHAVCDTDADLARRRAETWGARRVYTDFADVLADPDIDAVDILTPHHLHADQAVAAIEAGKHVSLQKPPTRTLAEFDRIVAAAARAPELVVRVFENFAWYPPHVRAFELIAEGAIGTPLSVRLKTAAGRPSDGWEVGLRSQVWRMDTGLCGGGPTTFDHGYHCYHMAERVIPAEIDRVHAFIHWNDMGDGLALDGPAMISWRYAGEPARYGSWEVIASVGMSVRSDYYASDDRMEVHGSEGILWVNRCSGRLLEEPSLVLYRDGETRAFHDLESDWGASLRDGGIDFVDAVLAGRRPAQTLAQARRTLRFALAAGRSAAEGREVALAEMEA